MRRINPVFACLILFLILFNTKGWAENKPSPSPASSPVTSVTSAEPAVSRDAEKIQSLEAELKLVRQKLDDLEKQTNLTIQYSTDHINNQVNFILKLMSAFLTFLTLLLGIAAFFGWRYSEGLKTIEKELQERRKAVIKIHEEVKDEAEQFREFKDTLKNNMEEEEKKSKELFHQLPQDMQDMYKTQFDDIRRKISEVAEKADILETFGMKPGPYTYFAQAVEAYNEKDYQKAADLFEKVTQISPNIYEAWNNWGNALLDLGKMNNDGSLIKEAIEKFKKAVDIKPDMPEALNNWGAALHELGKMEKDESLFRESFEKYEKAVEIKPDYHEAWYNWGTALYELGKINKEESLFKEAFVKFKKALEIKPDLHEALNNWGVALSELGKINSKDESLFRKEFEKYERAVEIKPDKYETLCNWGMALNELGKMNEDESLLKEAIEKFEKAMEIKPDYYEAYNSWGFALLVLGQMKEGKEREDFFDEAEEKFSKAEDIKTSSGSYNLACLNAFRGRKDEAISWLKKSLASGMAPGKDHILSDKDLNSIRDDSSFKNLME